MVEVLVAIVILGIGVLGPLALAVRNVPDGNFLKNKLAATYLAKEGLELVTNLLDSNYEAIADGTTSFSDLVRITGQSYSCADANDPGCRIYVSGLNNLPQIAGCNSASDSCNVTVGGTDFNQVMRLTETASAEEYRVDMIVSWRERNRDERVILSKVVYVSQ